MNIRERVTSKDVLAISLALIMLMSVGGMAFIGGAGAQATGGTYDQVFSESEDVSDDLNLPDGSVELVGPDATSGSVDGVSVAADGQVKIDGTADQTFRGITLSNERIAAVSDASNPASDQLADFLTEVPAEYNVSTNGTASDATPAVFIELDPQSEFSQIDNVDGTHDYIVVAPASDTQLNGTVDTNITPGANGINAGEIVALSVDNADSTEANSSLLANASDFGTVFGDLVGSSESDLQNKNVDEVQFAAGTFDDAAVSIQEVELGDDISTFEPGQTVHSEKIALDTGSNTTFFSSVSEAVNASDGGNTITVDRGEYGPLEGQNVTVDTNDTIQTTDRVNSVETINRVTDGTIDDPDNEAIINTSLEVTDNASVNNIVVQNSSSAVVNVTSSEAALNDVIVNATAFADGVNATVSGVTLTDSTVLANDVTTFEDGEVGLELNDAAGSNVANNYFVGFETQVANVSNTTAATSLRDRHADEFTDTNAQSAIAVDSNGDVTQTSIFGSINSSDKTASDGNTIQVSAGTYNEDAGAFEITTDNISVDGAGDDATFIENSVDLNSTETVTLADANVNGSIAAVENTANNGTAVTVDDVTLPGSNITVANATTVDIQSVTFEDAGVDAINITADLDGALTIDSTQILNLTAGTGISVPDAGDDIAITNTTIEGNATGAGVDGIVLEQLGQPGDETGDVDITGNDLSGIADGTALLLNETAGTDAAAETVDIDGNSFESGEDGTDFTGIEYNLDETTGSNITDNTIIGADVSGGSDSVGIDFVNVTVSSTDSAGITDPGNVTVEALTINGNTLNGHARIINAQDPEVISADYDNIDERNTIGTLVTGPDGATYEETYGEINGEENIDELGLDGSADSYLPGSLDEAVALVNASQQTGFEDGGVYDAGDSYTPTLQVYDIDVSDGPDTYAEPGPITFPDMEGLTITGEGDDQTPSVETRFVIETSDAINNHTVSDLAIDNADAEPAVNVTDGDNSQSTFENLNVTSDGSGVVVNATDSDVNVIEVRDSTFDVDADGIVLADGADDRDGFVIDNVTLVGSGIGDGDTGLDLTDVDKPGKTDPALETELTVQDIRLDGFEKQVNLSTNLTDDSAIDVEEVLAGDVTDVGPTDITINISEADVEQAVTVFDEDAGARDGLQNEEVIYGSIDTADAEATADAILDVRAGMYDHGGPVTLAADHNVIVEGAQAGNTASESLRGDETIVTDTIEATDNSNDLTLDGLSVLADNGAGVNVRTDGTVNVNNTAITNVSDGASVDGVDVSSGSDGSTVVLSGSFIGDHEEGTPVQTGIIADDADADLTVDASTTLDGGSAVGVDIDDLADSTATINGDVANFTTGVSVDDATEVTITGDISDNDAQGVSVVADATLTVTEATISNNGAEGILVDSAGAVVDVDQSTVENNDDGAGIQLLAVADGATHNVTRTNFSGNAGFAVDADTSAAATANVTLRGNAFNGTDAITSTETIDGTLNYFGDRKGPASAAGANVSDTVVYDPFLTGPETDRALADIRTTTGFAHDVIVPEDGLVSVGFPADPGDDTEIEDVFDVDNIDGNVYALDRGSNAPGDETFTTVDPSDDIEAFDAFVVEANDDARVVTIEYANDRSFSDPLANTYQFEEGINFVPAQAAGTVNEALFTGEDSDSVQLPFATGDNLYGTDAAQVRDEFTDPSADGFFGTFRTGAGDEVVHPHVGYIVTVNDEASIGNQRAETIMAPDAPTAANIDERTDTTAGVVTNVQTGATYDDLQVAVDEAQDGQTLELGVGTFTSDTDPVTISNEDLTIRGAGEDFSTVNNDIEVRATADGVTLRDFEVVGSVDVSGNAIGVADLTVTANSPGNLTLASGVTSASINDADIEGKLSVTEDKSGISISNTVAGTVSVPGSVQLDDVSQRTVTVTGETELDAALSGTNNAVGPQTTVVVDDGDIDATEDVATVSVDGVTLDLSGNSITSNGLDITADDVTVTGDSISDSIAGVTSSGANTVIDTVNTGALTAESGSTVTVSNVEASGLTEDGEIVLDSDVVREDDNALYANDGTAIGDATGGSTVTVADGTYDESGISLSNSETVQAADGATPTVAPDDANAFSVTSAATIDGLTIEATSTTPGDVSAISVAAGSEDTVTVQNVDITLTAGGSDVIHGIEQNSGDLDVQDSTIDVDQSASADFHQGVDVQTADLTTIDNVTFTGDHGDAVHVRGDNVLVKNSEFDGTNGAAGDRIAVNIASVSNVTVTDNRVAAYTSVLADFGDGDSSDITVTDNEIVDIEAGTTGYAPWDRSVITLSGQNGAAADSVTITGNNFDLTGVDTADRPDAYILNGDTTAGDFDLTQAVIDDNTFAPGATLNESFTSDVLDDPEAIVVDDE